ncbi:PadR family transcriptional regulator [Agromyces mediolanus]|uniref:PadR family transcriptional regulator n=1 Tax=Agromyces mediolanus TaxID=41986 RepID=UPI00383822D7
MAVREALLAILGLGPAYGFALHGGLAERTGGRRAINVGQTYATLDRATKSGLIAPAGTTDDGLPLHALTPAGQALADAWVSGADAAGADAWDETVDRVLIAASLPGTALAPIVTAERERWLRRLETAHADAAAASGADSSPATEAPGDPEATSQAHSAKLRGLAAAADAARARAALAWLDEVAAVAASGDPAFAPSLVRPRRGRRRTATREDVQPSASA